MQLLKFEWNTKGTNGKKKKKKKEWGQRNALYLYKRNKTNHRPAIEWQTALKKS